MGRASRRSCRGALALSGGPGWGAELSRRTLSLSPRRCAEQGACGDHFLQGKCWPRRPAHGTGGQGPFPPCQPWPHCYFFQLKKENISSSSSSSSLHSALGGQRAEDRRVRMGNPPPPIPAQATGKGPGSLFSGPAWPLDPWVDPRQGPTPSGHCVLVSKHTGFYQCFPNVRLFIPPGL